MNITHFISGVEGTLTKNVGSPISQLDITLACRLRPASNAKSIVLELSSKLTVTGKRTLIIHNSLYINNLGDPIGDYFYGPLRQAISVMAVFV